MSVEGIQMKINNRVITRLLGEELVENKAVAIAEQIKNAIDANATGVLIDLSDPDKVTIQDDGEGINPETIGETWLEIGTSNKELNIETSGGKGIGRLSLFTIGKNITVTSSYINGGKTTFSLDDQVINSLGDNIPIIDVNVSDKESEKHGTKIVVSNLKGKFNYQDIQLELKNLILDDSEISLKILFPSNYDKLNLVSSSSANTRSLFKSNFNINFDYSEPIITYNTEIDFEKNGSGYKNNINTKMTLERLNEIKSILRQHNNNFSNIGNVDFEARYFYSDYKFRSFLDNYVDPEISDKELKRDYLSYNSGINIYGRL